MTDQIDLNRVVVSLAERRKIFHSEADFQHELAWILREQDGSLDIRLEHPRHDRSGAIDLVARRAGKPVLALELKYLCRGIETTSQNEAFSLKAQSAYPLRRYDVVKDLEAVERFAAAYPGAQGAVIVLTNDRGYWQLRDEGRRSDEAFRFQEGRTLGGLLDWAPGTTDSLRKGRAAPINLEHSYATAWRPYSVVDEHRPGGELKFLCLEVPQVR